MGKIATEQDVYNVGKQGTPVANKCCTKQRMVALGCEGINGIENYPNNRLIPKNSYRRVGKTFKVSIPSSTTELGISSLEYGSISHTRIDDTTFVIKVHEDNWSIGLDGTFSTSIQAFWVLISEELVPFTSWSLVYTNSCSASIIDNVTEKGIYVYGLTLQLNRGFACIFRCNFGDKFCKQFTIDGILK